MTLDEAAVAQAFALNGKTIKGTMGMGDRFVIHFEDDTRLWLRVHHWGRERDGGTGRTSIVAELREG